MYTYLKLELKLGLVSSSIFCRNCYLAYGKHDLKQTQSKFQNSIVDESPMYMKVFQAAVQCTEFLQLEELQYTQKHH